MYPMPPTFPVPVAARLAPVQVIAAPPGYSTQPNHRPQTGEVANTIAWNPPPSIGDQTVYLTDRDLTRDLIIADPYRLPYRGPESYLNGLYQGQETFQRRRDYRQLERLEPAVRAAITLKVANIAALKLSVHPRDKTKPLDVRAAKFFKWTVEQIGVDQIISELLRPALIDGWALSEYTLDAVTDDAEWRGQHGLIHVSAKDTFNLKLETDEFRNILRVVNIVRGIEYFNKEKMLIYTHNGMYSDPFGQSDICAAYRSAKLIDEAYQLWYYALETNGSPFIKGIYNSNEAGFKEQFEQVLRDMRAKGYGAVKVNGDNDPTDIEIMNLAAATSFEQFERFVDKLRQEIWTAIHGTYLPFTEGSGKDPRGNTEVSQDVGPDPLSYLLALSVARCLEKQLAKPVTQANFGPFAGCPKIMLGGIDYEEVNKVMGLVQKLQDLGLPVSKDFVREITQIPDGDSPEDQLMPQAQGGPAGPGDPNAPPGPGGPGGGGDPNAVPAGPGSPQPPQTGPGAQQPGGDQQPADEDDDQGQQDEWGSPQDAEILQAALAKATAEGDHETVRALTELGNDPEALAGLLEDIEDGSNEGEPEDPRRSYSAGVRVYAWRAGTTASGKLKAISDSGQKPLYGERARRAIEASHHAANGTKPPPRKAGGAAAAAQAKKAAAEEGSRRTARQVWQVSKANPAAVKPHEIAALSEHLHTLTAAELAQHLKDIGKRVGGLKADRVNRLLEHFRGPEAMPGETKEPKPEAPAPESAKIPEKTETIAPKPETPTEPPHDGNPPRPAPPAETPPPETAARPAGAGKGAPTESSEGVAASAAKEEPASEEDERDVTKPVGHATLKDGRRVELLPHPNQRPDETTILSNPTALVAAKRAAGDTNLEPTKTAGVQRYLQSGKPLQGSRAALGDDGSLDVTDGRHRAEELAAQGADQMAVTVPKHQAEEFQKRFGGSGDVVRPMQAGETSTPSPTAAPAPEHAGHAATVSKWLDKSTASPEHKAKFHADMTHVLSKLPPASAKAATEALNDGSVTFHADIAGVEASYVKHAKVKSGKGVVGFVQSRRGDDRAHMYVDGDGGTASDLVAKAIYSHELGHAIDAGNRYSSDPKWQSAWKSEIFNGRTLLSKYARKNEAEGFAELYKAIAEKGLDQVKLTYPKCVKFLESKGLV